MSTTPRCLLFQPTKWLQSKAVLGTVYRDVDKSLVDMAYSLIERGIAKRTKKYRGVPFGVKLP